MRRGIIFICLKNIFLPKPFFVDSLNEAVLGVKIDRLRPNLIPDIELSTTSIDFEGIPVGESASLELLVLNNGDADLTITGASISGSSDF